MQHICWTVPRPAGGTQTSNRRYLLKVAYSVPLYNSQVFQVLAPVLPIPEQAGEAAHKV